MGTFDVCICLPLHLFCDKSNLIQTCFLRETSIYNHLRCIIISDHFRLSTQLFFQNFFNLYFFIFKFLIIFFVFSDSIRVESLFLSLSFFRFSDNLIDCLMWSLKTIWDNSCPIVQPK